MRKLALSLTGLTAFLVGFVLQGCNPPDDCVIGSEGCDCTAGGACDPGLTCLSMTCVNAGNATMTLGNEDETTSDSDTNMTNTNPTGDGDPGDGDPGDGDPGDGDPGLKLDTIGGTEGGNCVETGCKKVDMLFAMDGSASMLGEINALKAGAAFLDIVDTLEALNCGGIDYRIGVTGDNDNGWVTPPNWAQPDPWFDSMMFTSGEITTYFGAAATLVGNSGGAPLGCEHVLTSAVNLLGNDNSGFLRDDALLVLVLMSDVDDYGWYDQANGNDCGIGCQVSGQPVQTLQDTLVALKGGDPAGVSAIVIAGDPSQNAGPNFCGQPQSCASFNESAFHAERLYEFADVQTGMNGYAADICDGVNAVPDAVATALSENIDLACQEYTPEG